MYTPIPDLRPFGGLPISSSPINLLRLLSTPAHTYALLYLPQPVRRLAAIRLGRIFILLIAFCENILYNCDTKVAGWEDRYGIHS